MRHRDRSAARSSTSTRPRKLAVKQLGDARLQAGKSGADVIRREARAGERHRYSRRGQGQFGRHGGVDRLQPRSRSAARAVARPPTSRPRSIAPRSTAPTKRSRKRKADAVTGSTGCCPAKFGNWYATADSLWQQGGRPEARRPLWLGRMVCPAWSRSFCLQRARVALKPSVLCWRASNSCFVDRFSMIAYSCPASQT